MGPAPPSQIVRARPGPASQIAMGTLERASRLLPATRNWNSRMCLASKRNAMLNTYGSCVNPQTRMSALFGRLSGDAGDVVFLTPAPSAAPLRHCHHAPFGLQEPHERQPGKRALLGEISLPNSGCHRPSPDRLLADRSAHRDRAHLDSDDTLLGLQLGQPPAPATVGLPEEPAKTFHRSGYLCQRPRRQIP